MKLITKADIAGARITGIHSRCEKFEEYKCTMIYFTVDRGFTFNLPWPGSAWSTVDLPKDAGVLPDEYWEEPSQAKVKWRLLGTKSVQEPSKKIDSVKKIKERTIVGVYCPKKYEDHVCYGPDDALLVLDDGTWVYCVTVAPQGKGTGLVHLTDIQALPKMEDLVDFFDVPLEEDRDQLEDDIKPDEGDNTLLEKS